jgi:hypothetical protein
VRCPRCDHVLELTIDPGLVKGVKGNSSLDNMKATAKDPTGHVALSLELTRLAKMLDDRGVGMWRDSDRLYGLIVGAAEVAITALARYKLLVKGEL